MPPKKRAKRGQKPKTKSAPPASVKAKGRKTKDKARASSVAANTRSKPNTKGSKTLEAAAGAGIRTTEELQDYLHTVRNSEVTDAIALQVADQENNEFQEELPPVAQTSNNATPEDDDKTSSSSSESDWIHPI